MNKKKKIAMIGVGMVGSGRLGQGIPAMVNGLKVLSTQYDITLYSFIPVDRSKVPEGILVRAIPSNKMPFRLRYIWMALVLCLDHLFNGKYDLVQAQSPFPSGILSDYFCKLFNVPWILSLHAGETVYMPEITFGDLSRHYLKKAAEKVCPKADVLMAMSQFQADMTRKNLMLERDILVLPRGIEVKPLKQKKIQYPVKFLHISNYHPVKDYETLLKTFSLLKQQFACELTIAGTDYGENFKALLDSLNLNGEIKHLGFVSNDQIQELFDASHILLHTSRYEGLPMVALEAMAYGTVVCGTRVGVMSDLSGRCCITVDPGDYNQLAKEVIMLMQNEDRYHQLRQQAHDWVAEHDMQWYIDQLGKLYFRLSN